MARVTAHGAYSVTIILWLVIGTFSMATQNPTTFNDDWTGSGTVDPVSGGPDDDLSTQNPATINDDRTDSDWTVDPVSGGPDDDRPTYPQLTSQPRLIGPVVEDDIYVMFYCEFNMNSVDPRARAIVYFPGSNLPGQVVAPPTTRVALHEKYLSDMLLSGYGAWLYCYVRTFWSDINAYSGYQYSNGYFAGISTHPNYLFLSDADDDATTLELYSSIPPTCTYRDNHGVLQGCELELEIETPPDVAVFSRDSVTNQITQCSFKYRPGDWSSSLKVAYNSLQPLKLLMSRQPVWSYRYQRISFKVKDSNNPHIKNKIDADGNSYPNPWLGKVLGHVYVRK